MNFAIMRSGIRVTRADDAVLELGSVPLPACSRMLSELSPCKIQHQPLQRFNLSTNHAAIPGSTGSSAKAKALTGNGVSSSPASVAISQMGAILLDV